MAATAAATPGLLFIRSRIKRPELADDVFNHWYNTVHVPDLVATSGIDAAFRYKRADPEQAEYPYLTLYPLRDVAFMRTAEIMSVPITHPSLPGPSHNVYEFADFDVRVYTHVWTLDSQAHTAPGPAPRLVTAALSPAAGRHDEYAAWSRELHRRLKNGVPSYRRSRLYRLCPPEKELGRDPVEGAPVFLTLHEFEDPDLSLDALTAVSRVDEGAESLVEGAQAKELFALDLLGASGDTTGRFPEKPMD